MQLLSHAHIAGNCQHTLKQVPSLAEMTCCSSPLWCDNSHLQTQSKEKTGLCPLTAEPGSHTACQTFSPANSSSLLQLSPSGTVHQAGFSEQFLWGTRSTCITGRKKEVSYCLSFIVTDTYFLFITAKLTVTETLSAIFAQRKYCNSFILHPRAAQWSW